MHNEEIQHSFDLSAKYYAYRLPPYLDDFFGAIASLLGFSEATRILDLGCGQGEVSRALSGYIGSAVGLDFSQKMLELAYKDDKIAYVHHDINAAPYLSDIRFDHFFIGRAIQWIDSANLQKTIDASLRKDGSVVVLGTDWAKQTPWLRAYREVRRRHGQDRRRPAAAAAGRPLERDGYAKLRAIGLAPAEPLVRRYPLKLTLEDLLKNVLSYGRVDDTDRLRQDLSGALAAFIAQDNTLAATIDNWALVYRRPASA